MIDVRHGDYRKVLADSTADLIVTSPPYNIGSKSPAKTGKRSAKRGTYDPKSYRAIREYQDDTTEDEYQRQQLAFIGWCYDHLNHGGTLAYNHKPRRCNGSMIHPMQWLLKSESMVLMEEIIWDRGSTHNHCKQMFWPHTERVYIFRKVNEPYALDNARGLEFRSDVWRVPRAKVNGHNAPFPLALVSALVDAFNPQKVMDPYLGSGTTAVAAKLAGCEFVGAEKLKKYVNQSKERIQEDVLRV